MTWNDVCEKAIKYFEDDIQDYGNQLKDTCNDLDIYFSDIHPMEELEDLYGNEDPLDIMKLALRSTDEWKSDFDLDREYFRIESDGSLTSTDDVEDPEDYLDADLIRRIYEKREYAGLPRFIEKLFAAYDGDEEDEEDEV